MFIGTTGAKKKITTTTMAIPTNAIPVALLMPQTVASGSVYAYFREPP